ncbi:MAG: DUF3488 and transglutaminase-like domain-containing protein [Gammaproteobacteria bacterium]|nr:DUF3488 and transglutaminase-like domain-containing protein [Gammaproteobacteria bacterium]
MKSPTALWHPRPHQWWGLGLSLTLSAAPHLLRLPLWLSAIWLLAVGWRLSLGVQGRAMPALVIRLLLTLAAGVALYLHFGTVLGRDAGSALLVIMVGLKLLELKQRRDATLLILLCYLLLAIQFMFNQAIVQVLYTTVAVLAITAVWITLNNPLDERTWRADALLAARLLGQAVPLTLILFVLFPRLPGPLWSLPSDAHGARTGLSGEMEPGRISQLALSTAVAFRADFAGQIPPPVQRYWRGPVFEMTDGRRWWGSTETPSRNTENALPFQPEGQAYRYVLTLEPNGGTWLPALELPASIPADVERLHTLELKTKQRIDALRRDAFISYPAYRISAATESELRRNLRLPNTITERIQQLAQQWRNAARSDRGVIDAALRYFHTEPFVYTLEPPLLGANPVDEFLFETRRGFCEHYAAAFTLLMRSAGIPARVVTGYQGGELNPLGGYLIVRQSDAHAWVELWLGEKGWVRFDPTAAVAPERVEHRIDLNFANSGDAVRFQLGENSLLARGLRRARFALDALNNGWNQWVLSYGPQRQQDLLASLGLRNITWRELAWVLLVVTGAALGMLALLLLRRARPKRDPISELYARFRKRLAQQGVISQPHEGPQALLTRIEQAQLPSLAAARRITELYIGLRYAANPDNALITELRRAVNSFNSR